MRRGRLKVVGGSAVYHCMSRTVNGESLLKPLEKERFRKMLWKVAGFSGVEILKRFRMLYPKATRHQLMTADRLAHELKMGTKEGARMRRMLLRRMGDVSEFMKTLKLRFSVWYNRSHGRFGPLWADRFKSVLVENSPWALRTVAAYIDLNPVRAGLVSDPKDYRFSGYGEALANRGSAREGISAFVEGRDPLKSYRLILFGKGVMGTSRGGKTIAPERHRKVREQQGSLGHGALLRARLRYFSEGKILGSREFVRSQLQSLFPQVLPGSERSVPGPDSHGLFAVHRCRFKKSRAP